MPSTVFSSLLTQEPADALPKRSVRADLRVVIVSDASRQRNGVGTYYDDLVHYLQERVACVRLFCPDSDDGRFLRMAIPLPGDRTQQLRLPAFVTLSRAIRALRPHVMVVPTPGPYGWCGARIARRLRIPLCVGHHTRLGALVRMYWKNPLGRLAGYCLQKLSHRLFRHSAIVLGNSGEMIRAAHIAGAPKTRLVGTPIAACFLDSPPAAPPPEINSVLYVGRLAFEKNIEAIVTAAEALPHIKFSIVGDGPQSAFVQSAASRLANLRHVGWTARERIVSLLDAHGMLVLPSRIESFGTAAMEAMARRRLVLVSGDCGILDWPEMTAGLFRIEEHESLADAICRIAGLAPEVRLQRALHGQAAARALNERTVTEWIDILDELRNAAAGSSR